MPGSSTTPGRSDLAMVRPKRVAFRATRILEELEMRDTISAYRDQFAIDHGIMLYALKRSRHFDVTVADDLAIAAVKGDLTVLDCCDHTESVILVLE